MCKFHCKSVFLIKQIIFISISARTFFFTARLLTSVIEIKLNHLTKHFMILPCEGHHAAASTNPLSKKSQRRTPFSVGKKKNCMIRDSLSFLMLFLLLSHNPISFYVLCSECICVRICLDISYDLFLKLNFSFIAENFQKFPR